MKIVLIWLLQLQTIEMSWLELILVNPSYNSLELKKKVLKIKNFLHKFCLKQNALMEGTP